MSHPGDLSIAGFNYVLPEDRIATRPLGERDASRLLLYNKGVISESAFKQIGQFLPEGALLVFNNSRVIQSRLSFKKAGGSTIEIFILEPCVEYGDITTAMKTTGSIRCICLVGGAKKWKQGKLELVLTGDGEPFVMTAEMIIRRAEDFVIELKWQPETDFATALELFGNTPIPPYLQRPADETDRQRYQTIYAKENGSVAAPTAGLHFTPAVMQTLEAKNIASAYTTLHVGAGTFKPVKAEKISGHEMHAEYITIDFSFIDKLIAYEKIIPVGTTSMRTIESLYWMGVKAWINPAATAAEIEIHQWDVYDEKLQQPVSKEMALGSLQRWMQERNMPQLIVKTQIMIAPPYQPKIVTGLVTNFHQPQSTLLLLIAALTGDDWKKMYDYALANGFRFLSYGDSSYISW